MLVLKDISLRYGHKVLFDKLHASIGSHDRIGLVGSNGSGKTTLLKIINEIQDTDSGHIEKATYLTLGYLPQDGIEYTGAKLYDEIASSCEDIIKYQQQLDAAYTDLEKMEPDAPEHEETLSIIGDIQYHLDLLEPEKLKSKIEAILLGLGFSHDDLDKDTSNFSGGWQMRIALAKLLLKEPSLLLLDEPTNHLDLPSQRWVERYLKRYHGSMVIISHDKSFLDSLCNRIFFVSQGKLTAFTGGYTSFVEQREHQKQILLQTQKNQQKSIDKTEKFISRFRAKASKSKQVQSRIKALDKVERIEIENEESGIHFTFPEPPRCGVKVMELLDIQKKYDEATILNQFNLTINNGDKMAAVGANGAGKSTCAKILAGLEQFQRGTREVGHNVQVAYFAQHQAESLDPNKTVLQIAEAAKPGDLAMNPRAILGAFLFKGDDVYKPVKVLSGGEKCRLALACILMLRANLLILDEPTNHLDMQSIHILQQALSDYRGTVYIVSHDRSFLDPIVNKVLEFKPGQTKLYHGNVTDYLQKVEGIPEASSSPKKVAAKKDNLSAKERRQQQALAREQKKALSKQERSLEKKIETLEVEIADQEKAMLDPSFFNQGATTTKAMQEYDANKANHDKYYKELESVQDQLAKL